MPLDAQSEPARNRVNEWIFNTLMSRLESDPEDVVATLFAERCARYPKAPPAAGGKNSGADEQVSRRGSASMRQPAGTEKKMQKLWHRPAEIGRTI
jgi:hypothetical protein